MRRGQPRLPIQWQGQREPAAFSRRAVHINAAAVRVADVAYQGQAQAAALCVVHERIASAVELFEDLGLLAAGNADAVVFNFEFYRTILAIKLHAQELFVGRLRQGIVH